MTRFLMEITVLIGGSPVLSLSAKLSIVFGTALLTGAAMRRSRAALRQLPFAAAFLTLPVLLIVPVLYSRDIALPLEPVVASSYPSHAGVPLTVTVVWLAVASLLLRPVLAGMLQARRLRVSGAAWPEAEACARWLAAQMSITRPIVLVLHRDARGPMTCGVRRPLLVFPLDAAGWEAIDLERAIRHELAHVRRGDWIVQCIARVCCALCWINPLVWMAWKQLRITAEQACDDEVIRGGDVCGYAGQLVALAERLTTGTIVLPAMAGRGDLAARVRALLDETRHRGPAGPMAVTLTAATAFLLTASIAPLRAIRPTLVESPVAEQMLAFVNLQASIDRRPVAVRRVAARVEPQGPEVNRAGAPRVRPPGPRVPLRINGGSKPLVVTLSPRLRNAVHEVMTKPIDGEPPAMRVLALVRAYASEQAANSVPRFPQSGRRP